MTELITVDAVVTKPKYPKFNSGAVLSGKTWINVSKDVDINEFSKGKTVEVEVETNDKGYKLITKVIEKKLDDAGAKQRAEKMNQKDTTDKYKSRDFDAEARGKTKCKLYEAFVPALILLGLDDEEAKKRSDGLIEYFLAKVFEK